MLELRSRDTLPALLLFVVSALVVFNFSCRRDRRGSPPTACCGSRSSSPRCSVSRAPSRRSASSACSTVSYWRRATGAIWLGKSLSVLGLLVIAEAVALPAFALFFAPVDATLIAAVLLADVGLAAVGTLLAAMAAASRARELLLPLLFLPLVIPLVVGGVGATVAAEPARYLGFLVLYDALFAILSWATFEYVVTE